MIIDPLPHLHQSEFEVIAPQAGMPGTSAIGHFQIPLFPPGSDKYKLAKPDYDALKSYARCEAYYTTSGQDPAGAIGTPAFTGVITELPRGLNDYSIVGLDSLHLLALQRSSPSEGFPLPTLSGSTDNLVKYALKGYQLTFGDGQTRGGFTLGNYTNNGGWTTTTDDGFNAVQTPSNTGDGLLYTTTSYANGKYADMAVEAAYHVTCNNAASARAEASVIAAVADASNYVMGRAAVNFVNATRYTVDAEIWSKISGGFTLQAKAGEQIILPAQDGRLQVRLTGYQLSNTQYLWKLYINGQDFGVHWQQGVVVGHPTGAVGLRSLKAGVFAAESAWCSQFSFWSKANLFQNGNIGAGAQSLANQVFTDTPMIDMLALAHATEGKPWRKNPVAGLNNDTIDFNHAATSADLTSVVRLEEGVNLIESTLEPNADRPLTGLLGTGTGSIDGSGIQRWYNFPAIDKYGLVISAESFPHANDTLGVRRLSDQSLAFKSTPDQAKRLQIVRTMDLVDTTKPFGLRFRDGDTVTLRVPRQYTFDQKITIMSGKVVEGSPIVECTADQYPRFTDRWPAWDRLVQSQDADRLRMSERSAVNSTLGGNMQRSILLPSNPYKVRVHMTSTQNVSHQGEAATTVNLDTVDFDTINGWNTTNHQYTVPIDGYYALHGKVNYQLSAGAVNFMTSVIRFYQNGNRISEGYQTNSGDWTGTGGGVLHTGYDVTTTDIVFLNAGDLVDLRFAMTTSPANTLILQSGLFTFAAIHLIST